MLGPCAGRRTIDSIPNILLVSAAVGLVLTGPARAAPVLLDVVAENGQAAPGAGGTFELLNQFNVPVFGAPQINAQGLIGFETNIRTPDFFTGFGGVWTAAPSAAPSLRFAQGEVGVQGASLPAGTTFFTGPVSADGFNRTRNLNNAGQIQIPGRVQFDESPIRSETAIFTSQADGSISLRNQLANQFPADFIAASDNNKVIGRGNLPLANGTGVETALSLYEIRPDSSPHRIATLGQDAPGIAGDVDFAGLFGFNRFGDVVQTNNGLLAFQQGLTGEGVVAFENDTALFADLGSGLTPIARAGDAAPVLSGAGAFASFFSSGSAVGEAPSLNSDGTFAFRATNNDADGARDGIWVGTGTADLDRIVRTGETVSTANGDVNFLRFERPQVNAGGDIFFSALTGDDFSDFESTIWSFNGNEFVRLVQSGQAAPGTNGVFETIPDEFIVNANGQVAFLGVLRLDAANGITPDNNTGLWAFDQDGNLSLIVREGTALLDQDGMSLGQVHEIFFNNGDDQSFTRIFEGGGSNNDDGRPSGLSDNGQISFGVTLDPDASGTPTNAKIVRALFQGQQPVAGFIFNGACGNGNWHATCADSNWEDENGAPTGRPPGDENGTEFATIPNAAVVIDSREVDVRALVAGGSLAVSQQLRLRENSEIENLTLDAKLIIDQTLDLVGKNNLWQGGEITGDAANVAAGQYRVGL